MKTFGLSTITGTSVRVYRKPTVIVVRSTAPTAAPTAPVAPAGAAALAKSNQQFLFTLPQQGYIWYAPDPSFPTHLRMRPPQLR